MTDPKGSATNLKGKNGASNGTGFKPATGHQVGRSDNPMVAVQPPRREDLQPSYAQNLVGESDQVHGWYGGMSVFILYIWHITHTNTLKSTLSELASATWVPFHVALSALIHTSPLPKEALVLSPSLVDSTVLLIPVLSKSILFLRSSFKSMSGFKSLVSCPIAKSS